MLGFYFVTPLLLFLWYVVVVRGEGPVGLCGTLGFDASAKC
jgi:hypothetical protein